MTFLGHKHAKRSSNEIVRFLEVQQTFLNGPRSPSSIVSTKSSIDIGVWREANQSEISFAHCIYSLVILEFDFTKECNCCFNSRAWALEPEAYADSSLNHALRAVCTPIIWGNTDGDIELKSQDNTCWSCQNQFWHVGFVLPFSSFSAGIGMVPSTWFYRPHPAIIGVINVFQSTKLLESSFTESWWENGGIEVAVTTWTGSAWREVATVFEVFPDSAMV